MRKAAAEPQAQAQRSRSRGAAVELPVKETLPVDRGRSPTSRAQKALEQLVKSQNKELAKGSMRVQLGRFAASVKSRKPARATSEVVSKPSRTFDEIDDMASRPDAIPFGAAVQKQRTTSAGNKLFRYQGQLVR